MGKRDEWQKIADAESNLWSAKSCEEIITELQEGQNYIVEAGRKKYQVEVQLLENTNEYVHVGVAVDGDSLLGFISPATQSFIRRKERNGFAGEVEPS
jgi:hypothetical protein